MTETDFSNEFMAMQQLYDRWEPSRHVMTAWFRQFKHFDTLTFRAAVQTHFEESGDKQAWAYKPDNTRIRKHCFDIRARNANQGNRAKGMEHAAWLFNQRPTRQWAHYMGHYRDMLGRNEGDRHEVEDLHALARKRYLTAVESEKAWTPQERAYHESRESLAAERYQGF